MSKKSKWIKYIFGFIFLLLIIFSIFIAYNWDNFYRIKEVKIREINCSNKAQLLNKVYLNDQRIRKTSVPFKEFVTVDHENLEIVISIIEKCGMPTLKDVNELEMSAIWFVFQHAIPKYRKEYFPLIKQAVNNGDLTKENYALMKDRILMDEGKPQIYGSQIKNGKLYKLKDPESVNSRRKEMNMRPIQEYLNRFNIKFKIEQKK